VQLTLTRGAGDLLGRLRKSFADVEFEPVSDFALRAHAARPLPLAPLIRFFEEADVQVTEARIIRPSLEDVFVEITGIELERMRKEKEKGGRESRSPGLRTGTSSARTCGPTTSSRPT
jgi:ABC-2 type transport system ATP-binding protein